MTTKRELTNLAAKAAGITIVWERKHGKERARQQSDGYCGHWQPLDDDGDALRLAMTLDLLILPYPLDNAVRVTRLNLPDTIVSFGTPPDRFAATRRAIVRAAAELGRRLA